MQRLLVPVQHSSLKKRIFWRSFILLMLLIASVSLTAIVCSKGQYHETTQSFYAAQARMMAMQIPEQVLWDDKIGLMNRLQRTVTSDKAIAYAYLTVNNKPMVHTFEDGFPQGLLSLTTGDDRNIAVQPIKDEKGAAYCHIMVNVGTTDAVLHFGILHRELNRRAWNNMEQILAMSLLALVIGAAVSRQIACITTAEVEQTTEKLAAERCFLQSVIDSVVDPLRVIDNEKQIILMNRSAKNQLTDSQQGETCFDNYCGELDDQPCPLAAVRDSNSPMRIIQHRQHKDGSINICEIEASPLIEKGQIIGIVETTRDITDRIKLETNLDEKESRLIYMSRHDQLTNLPNRIQFRDRLTMTLAGINDSDKVALLFIGLDRFKKINEALGREVGDQVLIQVAQRLKRCLSNDELIARLGSDEFAVIIEDSIELRDTAISLSRQILEQFYKPIKINDYEIYLTTSIGISFYPDDGNNTKQLLTNADIALTCAKTAGKNRYQFFETTMICQTKKFFKLENDLRKALEKEQLEVYYQPQINLNTQQITGLEALVRWNHPKHGLVSPLDFIPLAEENGLIVPIGEWVLRRSCEQLVSWHKQGFAPLTVAVNLSPVQFRQANLVKTVARIIAETGIDPDCLELEITESMIMDGLDKATTTMLELTELGVKLAIDDFGTGYSSLSYLRYFPLSKLKIDKCFVERITTDKHDAALATAVIALAHSLNLKVIAEGIETEEQAHFLHGKNCHQGQGFLYSKPLPADQFVTLITNNRKNSPLPL